MQIDNLNLIFISVERNKINIIKVTDIQNTQQHGKVSIMVDDRKEYEGSMNSI